jgi:hypothetical protein
MGAGLLSNGAAERLGFERLQGARDANHQNQNTKQNDTADNHECLAALSV